MLERVVDEWSALMDRREMKGGGKKQTVGSGGREGSCISALRYCGVDTTPRRSPLTRASGERRMD
jgi:hypothetical protein